MAREPQSSSAPPPAAGARRRRHGLWRRVLLAVAGGGTALVGLYLASVAALGPQAPGATAASTRHLHHWLDETAPVLALLRWSLYAAVLLAWPRLAAGLARYGAGWDGSGPEPPNVRHLRDFLLALRLRAIAVLIAYEALFVFRLHAILPGAQP